VTFTLTGSLSRICVRVAPAATNHPATKNRIRRTSRNAHNDRHVQIGFRAPTLRSWRAWRETFFGALWDRWAEWASDGSSPSHENTR
jgi:hypothetical protein